ncbi:hypothetical protein Leryth_000849 [Lithospermum erythrorhizon]|nr:hypothetical protein Leryth_000849 [Lithospermum erythrorhizon]
MALQRSCPTTPFYLQWVLKPCDTTHAHCSFSSNASRINQTETKVVLSSPVPINDNFLDKQAVQLHGSQESTSFVVFLKLVCCTTSMVINHCSQMMIDDYSKIFFSKKDCPVLCISWK